MLRTETVVCPACDGSGADDVGYICGTCTGNGYVPADAFKTDPLKIDLVEASIAAQQASMERAAELTQQRLSDIDLTATTPPPGRMANQTWRILEEQRQAAEDTVRECENEIERWTNKMVDAMKTKGMCEAGQRALDGVL